MISTTNASCWKADATTPSYSSPAHCFPLSATRCECVERHPMRKNINATRSVRYRHAPARRRAIGTTAIHVLYLRPFETLHRAYCTSRASPGRNQSVQLPVLDALRFISAGVGQRGVSPRRRTASGRRECLPASRRQWNNTNQGASKGEKGARATSPCSRTHPRRAWRCSITYQDR